MHDDICCTDGCDRPVKIKARRLCGRCYQAAYNAGELTDEVRKGRPPANRECSIDGCSRKHKAFGFCKKHLDEARREGEIPADECTFEGCNRVRHIQELGYCLAHYRQHKAGKPLTPIARRQKREGTCGGPECSDPVQAKGLCSSHYWQHLQGQELTPIKRVVEDLRGKPCVVCRGHGETRDAYTTDGLCRVHARRRAAEEEEWDRPVPQKAPNGAGHINPDGYRIITVNGRNVGEHRHMMEQILGHPLNSSQTVHHLNGNRADNRTDGPLQLVHGKLRSGNLELWSTSQPAGQEIGPKLEWAVEMQEEYAEFVPDAVLERMAAVLRSRGYVVEEGEAAAAG